MTNPASAASTTPSASPAQNILPYCSPTPLLKGEDAAAYADLATRVVALLQPSDIIEEIWVQEIVDHTWEACRWRRQRDMFINSEVPKTLAPILQPMIKKPYYGPSFTAQVKAACEAATTDQKLAADWAAGKPEAIKSVNELLASVGSSMDNVLAQTVAGILDKVESFNRLTASAQWRRDTLLREISRHRASFAQKARDNLPKIEDAEFETIEPDAVPAAEAGQKVAA